MSRRHQPLARAARVLRVFGVLLPLGIAACARQRVAVADVPPAPQPIAVVAPPLPAGPSPINANLSPAATLWHLRAALNVAALACRAPQEAMLAGQYNAMLLREKATFALAQTALSAEFRAGGPQWQDRYDHAMTRLYNFFSTAQAHDRFCAAAVQVMADAQTLAPGALPGVAAERLTMLDAAFVQSAPPLMAFAQPAVAQQAIAQPVIALSAAPTPNRPTARPSLEIDLSALPGD